MTGHLPTTNGFEILIIFLTCIGVGDMLPATMPKKRKPSRKPVLVMLDPEDYDRLAELCRKRGQNRADFLRAAIQVADKVPVINTRPLSGACLERHKAKVRREKAAKRRGKLED